MKLKICVVIGLIFLVLNQALLLKGNSFIQTQEPIDYAHWLLFLGVLLMLAMNVVFTGNTFTGMASILTSLGVIALIGQATIDFLWWSYGADYEGMNQLVHQIMEQPSIRIPFITIGPALFYLGIALHAGKFIKKHPIWSVIAIIGVISIGVGSFVYDNRTVIFLGHIVLAVGIVALISQKNIPHHKDVSILKS